MSQARCLSRASDAPWTMYAWLEGVLEAARAAGEKVVVLGHIPPGETDALPSYGDYYVDVVSRYADVIVLQLFGHT